MYKEGSFDLCTPGHVIYPRQTSGEIKRGDNVASQRPFETVPPFEEGRGGAVFTGPGEQSSVCPGTPARVPGSIGEPAHLVAPRLAKRQLVHTQGTCVEVQPIDGHPLGREGVQTVETVVPESQPHTTAGARLFPGTRGTGRP